MAARNYSNIAVDTTLATGIDADDTSLTVAAATGWPAAPFTLVIEPGEANEEIILVGGKSGTIFSSLTRGYNGSTGKTHAASVEIKHCAIAGDFTIIWTHDHAGDYTQIDHGALGGLSDADHPAYALVAHTHTEVFTFCQTDELVTGTGKFKLRLPYACTIVGCRASVDTAPTGQAVIVDINKSGTTIYTTQANRPTIAAAGTDSGSWVVPDVTAFAANEYFTVDIDQVGSTIPGSDLTVTVEVIRSS